MLKVLALLGLAALAKAAPAEDKVDSLPQMGTFSFNLYSGYLPIANTTKSLHYMFAESQGNPVTDPVIVWFNGGPGCSSMLGFTQEHGPFVMEDGGTTFHQNNYTWNKEANMLYIEAPAGVGFSDCGSTSPCNFNDDTSAADNLAAILYFYTNKFPEFQSNDLYISGESYGGIYVPYAAYYIDQYLQQHQNDTNVFKPNLKGYIVGNGVTNWKYDTVPAFIEMAFWHGLYDLDTYNAMKANNCTYEYAGWAGFNPANLSNACNDLMNTFNNLVSNINVYDVYGICYGSGARSDAFELYSSSDMGISKVANGLKTYKKSFTAADYTPFLYKHQDTQQKKLKDLPPCTFGNPIIAYLNSATVRQLLHIPDHVQAWDLCTNSIGYDSGLKGSQWIYEALRGKYRILFYSGDTDGAVPTYGTLQWMNELNWNITEEWRPYTVDGQVGGYLEARDGMTLGTVHGAGHMAPQWRRSQTYHLIFNWLKNRPI